MRLMKIESPDSSIPGSISLEKPTSHSSLRDSCDIVFRVKSNVEFTSQVIKSPTCRTGVRAREAHVL